MAHPRRSPEAEALAATMRRLPTRVVYDPDPDGPASTVRTARLAWDPWLPRATHHLVLQDDVFPHESFEEQVLHATTAQPDAILSFFSEWGSFTSHALRIAALSGHAWVAQPDTYLGTQAALMTVAAARQFSRDLATVDDDVPDDHAIHAFAHRFGLRYFVSNPNLVEHDVGRSLVGNGNQGARRATVFLPQVSPDGAWWRRSPLADLSAFPAMHWSTAVASTYVRPAADSSRWSVGPRHAWWGDQEGVLNARIRLLVDESPWSAQPRMRGPLSDIASVLSDQVWVASMMQTGPAHPIAELAAADAVRTIAPGSLRKIVGDANHELDLTYCARQLAELREFCERLIARAGSSSRSMKWAPG
jgi:hypothetical protein